MINALSERILVAGAVPADNFASDLIYGTRGTDVEHLQKILKRLGFSPADSQQNISATLRASRFWLSKKITVLENPKFG